MLEIAETGSAPLFLDRDAMQAKRTHLRPKLARKHIGAIDLLRDGRDLVLREAANRLAQRVGGFAQIVFQRAIVRTGHARLQNGTIGAKTHFSLMNDHIAEKITTITAMSMAYIEMRGR